MTATVSNDDSTVSIERPALYVVATPIGNLGDISPRAIGVLQAVDLILVEDKRVSAKLLNYYGVQTKMRATHEHNERQLAGTLVAQMRDEKMAVAQISDAGTPLISDPGYLVVNQAIEVGLPVISVPGPCAAIAALSVSGLATDQFLYVGFLSAKNAAKSKELARLKTEPRTLIIYEAPHRIVQTLTLLLDLFGESRRAVVARELTKRFETVYRGTFAELLEIAAQDGNFAKGELVLIVEGDSRAENSGHLEAARILDILLSELSPSSAAKLTAEITGINKNTIYQWLHEKDV